MRGKKKEGKEIGLTVVHCLILSYILVDGC